jgi:hypothetical protein
MKAIEISKLLGVGENKVRKYKGVFRYHNSYFYPYGKTEETLVRLVKDKIPTANIIDSGNHYHDFVGGAKSGSAKDSFFWVTFSI